MNGPTVGLQSRAAGIVDQHSCCLRPPLTWRAAVVGATTVAPNRIERLEATLCPSCGAPYGEHPKFEIAVDRLGAEVARSMAENGELEHPVPEHPYRLIDPSTVEPRAIEWLWRDRIPMGTLSLVAGPGGIGKGALWVDLAARATRGELDGDLQGRPVGVVVLTAEDRVADVISPRLRAAGAVPGWVRVMTMREAGIDRDATFPDDLPQVRRVLDATNARFLVIDPLNAHLAARIDSHKDAPLRRALAPLTRLAGDTGVAVIGIAHVNKGGGDATSRVLGSVGYVNAARAVLIVGRPPDDDEHGSDRIVAVPKSNLSPAVPSLRFRLVSRQVEGVMPVGSHGHFDTVGVEWRGEDRATADELLGTAEERSALAEAQDWLRETLGDGPQPRAVLFKQARSDGIAERTLHRAGKRLGVIIDREERMRGRPSMWRLPDYLPELPDSNLVAQNKPDTGNEKSDDGVGFVPTTGGGTKPRPLCTVCGQPNRSDLEVHPACAPRIAKVTTAEAMANVLKVFPNGGISS